MYDIRKAKNKLKMHRQELQSLEEAVTYRKRTANAKYAKLDESLWKWYKRESSGGMTVQGIKL